MTQHKQKAEHSLADINSYLDVFKSGYVDSVFPYMH